MQPPINYGDQWKRRSYEWKKKLSHSQYVSRGTKLLGAVLCDNYANWKTGCCWPSNEVLAQVLCVSARTIQRQMAELKAGGWICPVLLRGRRRALQLVLPDAAKGANRHDRIAKRPATSVTPKHDTGVAPYIEPRKNLRGRSRNATANVAIACICVGANEAHPLVAWKAWLAKNVLEDPEAILDSVRMDGGYFLPCRFPVENSPDRETYFAFFRCRQVITSRSRG